MLLYLGSSDSGGQLSHSRERAAALGRFVETAVLAVDVSGSGMHDKQQQ